MIAGFRLFNSHSALLRSIDRPAGRRVCLRTSGWPSSRFSLVAINAFVRKASVQAGVWIKRTDGRPSSRENAEKRTAETADSAASQLQNSWVSRVKSSKRLISASKLRQQQIRACRPIYTPVCVISTVFLVGLLFIPLGVVMLFAADSSIFRLY